MDGKFWKLRIVAQAKSLRQIGFKPFAAVSFGVYNSLPPMPEQHENQEWYRHYESAMLELDQAKLAGRIGDARKEIAARIEKLRNIPGLHEREKQAIEDALNALRMLEREDERAKADEYRMAEAALEKLRTTEPKLKNN